MTEHTLSWRPRGAPYDFFNELQAKHFWLAVMPGIAFNRLTSSRRGIDTYFPEFSVMATSIACREDMKKLLLATRGKVFTSQNLDRLVEFTRLKEFQTKQV
jgi:hypothetical protein